MLGRLGVEPLYPQLCHRYPVIRQPWTHHEVTPMELSAILNSVPCALSFSRDENMSIIQLIGLVSHCLAPPPRGAPCRGVVVVVVFARLELQSDSVK